MTMNLEITRMYRFVKSILFLDLAVMMRTFL